MAKSAVEQHDEASIEKFIAALQKTDEIRLTVIGRSSGRKISRPVWFVHEGDMLYLLAVTGSDSQWYKNVLENPIVTLSAKRATLTAKARAITDPVKVREIVEKFRAKYGVSEVKKYYSKFDAAVEVPLA